MSWRLFAGAVLTLALPAAAGPLDTLKPGEWYEVPNSQMRALDPCPQRTCSYSAVEGQSAVMDDWSGGAFDTSRNRLLVWGGGHGGYAGNELYAFDLASLSWSRLSNPSDPVSKDVPYAPDGQPTSRHTYDYIQYVPGIDSFCSAGGAGFYESGQTGTAHTDCFNFGTGKWEQHPDSPAKNEFIGAFTAVDPTDGHLWEHGCQGYSTMAEFDPAADAWISHGSMYTDQVIPSYDLTAAIQPARHLFLAVGGGASYSWDISQPGEFSGAPLTTTGDSAIVQAASPGFEWDTAAGLFVGWAGGADVLTLDPSTWAWTRVSPAATNAVTPTPTNMNGTFGRFRYSSASNVFVVVNSVDEDVFIYRLSNGSGTAPPIVQLTATPTTVSPGETSALQWTVSNASSCTASGGWSGSRPLTGQQTVGPLSATTPFVLSCTGPSGIGGSSVTVEVPGPDAGAPSDAGETTDSGSPQADAGHTGAADAGPPPGNDAGELPRVQGGCGCGAGGGGWLAAWALLLWVQLVPRLRRAGGSVYRRWARPSSS
jgi:hypothetical protein